MDKTIVLELDHDILITHNIQEVWISRSFLSPSYALCYKDNIYETKIIYTSPNLRALVSLKKELLKQIAEGKTRIRL